MDLLSYVKEHAKELPANRWHGQSHSGEPITVTEHHAGVDLMRGPWVKFKFTEGSSAGEIQGYLTWQKGERIKLDGKEADNDDLEFDGSVTGMPPQTAVNVIVRMAGVVEGKSFAYRFEGKTN